MDFERTENIEKEDKIDIRSYVNQILRIWYFFPISIVLCMSVGYYLNIKTPRIYNVTSTILIKKDAKSANTDGLMKGFGLFNNQQNVENEIGILKSYNLAEATIKNSNHFIGYYRQNKLRRDNIYQQSPFEVFVDPSHVQLLGSYKLTYVDNLSVKVELEQKGASFSVYDFTKFEGSLISKESTKLSVTVKLGQWIETPFLKIRIDPRMPVKSTFEDFKNESYFFNINDLRTLALRLTRSIKAEPASKQCDIINLSLTYDNVDEAVALLSEFVDQYSLNNLKEKNKIASNTIDFIDAQLDVLSDTLSSNESKLEYFRKNNNVINVDVQAQGAYNQSQRIGTDIAMAELRLKYLKYLEAYLQSHNEFKDIVTPSIMGISDPLLNKLVSDLFLLSSEKNKLLFNTTLDNPLVININNQIIETKNAISGTIKSLNSATIIEVAELKKNLNIFDKELMKIPETERSLIGIQRSFKINNDIYTFLLQKRAESAIAKASNMPDSQIIDDARAMNTNPISPKKTSLYLISLIIGLIFPIVVIIIRKNIYDYVESKSDVSSISDIPIISSIPHSDHEVTSVVNDFPKSDISEAFRGLRTKLKFILNNTNNNTLLITSSIPAEGKTFLAVNIAIGYAITNKKTIILGVDLRKPRLTKVFDSDSPFGVSTYLSGQSTIAESIMKTHIDNLDYFPAGPIPPNPSELIGNEKMGALIEQLKTNYEYIIIDSPPINIVSDAIQLFPLVDTILYVVRLNYTRKRFLDDVNLLFTTKKVKNIGLVINDDLMNDRYGYRYKYGYKYKYNYYYEENKTKKNKNKLLSLFKKSK